MTVKELIDELQKLPQELPIYDYNGAIERVYVRSEYPLGDTANPKCEYTKVVYID